MPPSYTTCPNCGQLHDTSGRYTSPENRELDRRWWKDGHLSGACLADTPAEPAPLSPEARFNQLKDRLIAATGLPGLTSFHGGHVHMTLAEWERLIVLAESAQTVSQH